MKEILTPKRCGYLLIAAGLIYFLVNIIMAKGLVIALVGALCSTAAFGLFLYFIRVIIKEKQKKKPKCKKCGKEIEQWELSPYDKLCTECRVKAFRN